MKNLVFALHFVFLLLSTQAVFSRDSFTAIVADSTVLQSPGALLDSLSAIAKPGDIDRGTRGDRLDPVYDFISTRKVLWAVIVLMLTFIGIRLVIRVLTYFAERSTQYRFTIKGLIPLFRIIAWTFAIVFIVAGIFAPSLTTVLAFSASIGVAVGFAAQDILKNIFGGVMIIFDQPFKVGDKIEIGNHYGEVLEIGLRSTRIVTADDSIVSVPNAEVMNQSVSNANSGEANCLVVAEFYLPIDVDTEKVRKIAIEGAQVSRFVYLNKPIVALFFQEIKDRKSYLKMRLKAYVMDIRYEFAFKSDMTELVIQALIDEGIISKEDFI